MDGKLESIRNTFQALTGISGRHNRALREVRDWAANWFSFLGERALPGLEKASEDPDERVRREAERVLKDLRREILLRKKLPEKPAPVPPMKL